MLARRLEPARKQRTSAARCKAVLTGRAQILPFAAHKIASAHYHKAFGTTSYCLNIHLLDQLQCLLIRACAQDLGQVSGAGVCSVKKNSPSVVTLQASAGQVNESRLFHWACAEPKCLSVDSCLICLPCLQFFCTIEPLLHTHKACGCSATSAADGKSTLWESFSTPFYANDTTVSQNLFEGQCSCLIA